MAKLRYQPGQFVRHNKTRELLCITLAYRLIREPNIWLYELEERESMTAPDTPMSIACEHLTGGPNPNRVISEPIRDTFDPRYKARTYNDYHHGNSRVVNTQTMLNEYTVVSSGEVVKA